MTLARRALVFDFDGVLADTEPLIWQAWAGLLAPHNIAFTWDDYCRLGRGATDVHMLARLPAVRSNPDLLPCLEAAIDTRRQIVRDACLDRSPIPATTASMLSQLHDFSLGLVTSSSRDEVEPLLRNAGILSCFHAMVCADDCARHKPDPEPYLLIRERLGVVTALAFEDSDAGLASAAAAGFTAIRVPNPRHLPGIVAAALRLDRQSLDHVFPE
jgi:HAD superfamily hydrolase (TIGR01509 family)